MNKINDRDLTELSSYWVYQNIDIKKEFKVNGKRFKQVDSYNDDKNSNLNGAADIKIYELLDDKSKPTGQQTIIYQGTSNEAINPNNPLKSSGFGDDWLQNAKLMNNDNESTDYLKQTDQLSNQYKIKLEDADRLSNSDFLKKYRSENVIKMAEEIKKDKEIPNGIELSIKFSDNKINTVKPNFNGESTSEYGVFDQE
ncbi:TPA: DUF1672 family protein [Staphylococcus aureus]|uniref:DUF1672 family protein n=1 Tax=Staphylococcus aureus TaxID=1280 RepID=UPI00287E331E|nr:DUF1672 family protein [Staphylococcus aureus]MDS6144933.1 hypothetical protein [Staphylococcus aureus subsp. aureus SA9080]HEJ7796927.1 DUF1672 family protein [Staphylococcus aureus]